MATTYKARTMGEDMGIFQPIRFTNGAIGYQGVEPKTGSLLGILWDDSEYCEPGRNGNTSWEICEETEGHRKILEQASVPWRPCPIEFEQVMN